jgi:hypothetical protein
LILAHRGALVALLAGHGSVHPEKRKAVLVILDLLRRNPPAKNAVALCTVRAHLPAVDVRVAILAVFPGVRKHRFDMALRALHFFVHSAKRIFRLVVIELRDWANRAPSSGRVAILTRYGQSAMRAARAFLLRVCVRGRGRVRQGENAPANHLDERVVCDHPVSSTFPSIRVEPKNPDNSVAYPTFLKQLYIGTVNVQTMQPSSRRRRSRTLWTERLLFGGG